jgi:hypothetical protein
VHELFLFCGCSHSYVLVGSFLLALRTNLDSIGRLSQIHLVYFTAVYRFLQWEEAAWVPFGSPTGLDYCVFI